MLETTRRYILVYGLSALSFLFKYTQGLNFFFFFYLSTFLKVDIDIITTPRRSHLTQLPIVFYAEQSGGELR